MQPSFIMADIYHPINDFTETMNLFTEEYQHTCYVFLLSKTQLKMWHDMFLNKIWTILTSLKKSLTKIDLISNLHLFPTCLLKYIWFFSFLYQMDLKWVLHSASAQCCAHNRKIWAPSCGPINLLLSPAEARGPWTKQLK